MEYRTHLDLDATPDASFGIFNFEDQQQISQEFQWLYKDDKFSLVSGLYYFNEDDSEFWRLRSTGLFRYGVTRRLPALACD